MAESNPLDSDSKRILRSGSASAGRQSLLVEPGCPIRGNSDRTATNGAVTRMTGRPELDGQGTGARPKQSMPQMPVIMESTPKALQVTLDQVSRDLRVMAREDLELRASIEGTPVPGGQSEDPDDGTDPEDLAGIETRYFGFGGDSTPRPEPNVQPPEQENTKEVNVIARVLAEQRKELQELVKKTETARIQYDEEHKGAEASLASLQEDVRTLRLKKAEMRLEGSRRVDSGSRRRQTMDPTCVSIYEADPTLACMGVDLVPTYSGLAHTLTEVRRQSERFENLSKPRHAAKRTALTGHRYTGSVSWKKFMETFQMDMTLNGWSKAESLPSLVSALRDGPGHLAVANWVSEGDGTYDSLVRNATWILGEGIGTDPMQTFETRVQKPGEGHRAFGCALEVLFKDADPGIPLSANWSIQQIQKRFVKGLRDPEMKREVVHHMTTQSSLSDLFFICDDYLRKKTWFGAELTEPHRSAPYLEEEADLGDNLEEEELDLAGIRTNRAVRTTASRKETRKSTPSKPAPSSLDMDAVMQKVQDLVKSAVAEVRSSRRKSSKSSNMICYRCQEKGHLARECLAPKPVPRADPPSEPSVN